ncbi:hypothetical protein D7X55_08450 [Corallococcus sp. AB049A]|uniref:RICIN domain-containing protein n=1 Tax=Corallococcus sp. AB049A TaxID=2316721 RepID=UPI000ECFEBD2|nr:RICIN domain-containing protein [Corallococcus sp. AB049A]RKI71958.1 hypothetical protein D7X55_08450 [Corallococcus sp. AB049A]
MNMKSKARTLHFAIATLIALAPLLAFPQVPNPNKLKNPNKPNPLLSIPGLGSGPCKVDCDSCNFGEFQGCLLKSCPMANSGAAVPGNARCQIDASSQRAMAEVACKQQQKCCNRKDNTSREGFETGVEAGFAELSTKSMFDSYMGTDTKKELALRGCLDVARGETSAGAEILQFTCRGGDHQRFKFEDVGGGLKRIRAKHSDMCFTVEPGGGVNPGAHYVQAPCTGAADQSFSFTEGEPGWWRIEPSHAKGLCLDIEGGSLANGTRVIQNTCDPNSKSQLFWVRQC